MFVSAPKKEDYNEDDKSEEFVQVVRKSIVPSQELIYSLNTLPKEPNCTSKQYKKTLLLHGIPEEFHETVVAFYENLRTDTNNYLKKTELVDFYIPVLYRIILQFVSLDESPISKLEHLSKIDIIQLIVTFNKTYEETFPVLQKHFKNVDQIEVIIDLFSQDYIHNFIELQRILKQINSEL